MQIPVAAKIEATVDSGESRAPLSGIAEPSKLSKLLTRMKETLTRSAAQSIAVSLEASQAPELPIIASTTTAPTPMESAKSIEIDFGAPARSETNRATTFPSTLISRSTGDWKEGFVVRPSVSPNVTLKVTVPSHE